MDFEIELSKLVKFKRKETNFEIIISSTEIQHIWLYDILSILQKSLAIVVMSDYIFGQKVDIQSKPLEQMSGSVKARQVVDTLPGNCVTMQVC